MHTGKTHIITDPANSTYRYCIAKQDQRDEAIHGLICGVIKSKKKFGEAMFHDFFEVMP